MLVNLTFHCLSSGSFAIEIFSIELERYNYMFTTDFKSQLTDVGYMIVAELNLM
jgi:hypothetical protein